MVSFGDLLSWRTAMEEEKLGKLLSELAERTAERVRPGLAEEIKEHIPVKLSPHRKGVDTINIMIDLRVSKLAAAAVIVVAMLLLASFFGGRNSHGSSLYQDWKLLAMHILRGEDAGKSEMLAGVAKLHEYLVQQGKEVVFYGDNVDIRDDNAVLMHWKVSDSRYTVIFSDLREMEVSAEELIELQARMLHKSK
jgi:hypothetical protein